MSQPDVHDTLFDAQLARSAMKFRHARQALEQVRLTLVALDETGPDLALVDAVSTVRYAAGVLHDALNQPAMDPDRAFTLACFLRDEAWRLLEGVQKRA